MNPAELAMHFGLGMHDRVTGDGGGVHALELLSKDRTRLAKLAPLFARPELSELAGLTVTFKTAAGAAGLVDLGKLAPPTLRSLQLGVLPELYVDNVDRTPLVDVAMKLLPSLPALESLALCGVLYFVYPDHADTVVTLVHSRLASLTLAGFSEAWPLVATLVPAALPALTRMAFWTEYRPTSRYDQLCVTLGAGGWLGRLTHLSLHGGELTDAGIGALVRGLGGRRLCQLTLTDVSLSAAHAGQLALLCDELVAPDVLAPPVELAFVEHANKPEWGRGRIVRRFDDKLEVAFATAGTKIFKADSPFLSFS